MLDYIPDFPSIKSEDYLPVIKQEINAALSEIDAIAANPEPPCFANTIEALERSGKNLDRALGVFYPLLSADADDTMMATASELAPLLSDFGMRINLNEELYRRVYAVSDASTPEQKALLDKTLKGFERSGITLPQEQREEFKQISARLSELTTLFSQNVKKELAAYRFPLTADQIDGLPDWLLEQAADTARREGASEPYVLTLEQPAYMAFMKDSPHDDLRHRLWLMYNSRNRQGEFSNTEIIKEIVTLRLRMARMLGHKSFAHYKLERTMAQTPDNVMNLLEQLRQAYAEPLRREMEQLQEFAGEPITPWNYSYHFNRLRKQLHDFDPEEMRPYFELGKVTEAVFGLASRLYGISLTERTDVPVYHPDVKVFEAKDEDGSPLGLLYCDFFPRAGRKSPGAWMTEFREADGTERPLVNIVMNFTKPTASKPSLLSPGEVGTLLHEFGHALHALLTKVKYSSIAGTNVFRDFVELPSQFNENYLHEPEFLRSFGVPDDMIRRMIAASQFGAAYTCMRQLGFAYLDMAWHSVTESPDDLDAFETAAILPVRIFEPTEGTSISPTFGHIFSGGYAAGYYSYKWAEVLDADAFALFQERGVFDRETAMSFRRNILERGGSEHPATLYRRFRGRDASVAALLRRDGIASANV